MKGIVKWAALVVAVMASATVLVACGSSSDSGDEASPAAEAKDATTIMTEILGHEPTGLAAEIAERGSVVVANAASYAPFSYIDDNGEMVGFDVDAARGMADMLGLELEQKQPAWDSIPTGLQTGRFDVCIASMSKTAERSKTLDFTSPYYWVGAQLAVKQGAEPIAVDELSGKTAAVAAQTTGYYWLKDNIKGVSIKTYPTDAEALQEVARSRADVYFGSPIVITSAITGGSKVQLSGEPLYYENCSFALNKGEADWQAVLDYTVTQMMSSGYLKAKSEEWVNGLDLTVKPPAGTESEM